jgi:hypothetical protein
MILLTKPTQYNREFGQEKTCLHLMRAEHGRHASHVFNYYIIKDSLAES